MSTVQKVILLSDFGLGFVFFLCVLESSTYSGSAVLENEAGNCLLITKIRLIILFKFHILDQDLGL